MIKWILLISTSLMCVNCASLADFFSRRSGPQLEKAEETAPAPAEQKRTTRRSIEEESMLGESSGSLWSGRGQASFLFVNNNQRLIGDLLNVNIDGYPKEQIQMKVNTIAKLLSQILNDQKQDIRLKEEKKAPAPKPTLPEQGPVQVRGVASTPPVPTPAPVAALVMSPESEREIKKIDEEASEIKELQEGKEFPIRAIPTHVVDINKDGTYRVKGERPFMIGKREYKLTVSGIIKPEDFDDKGVSAEVLMDPEFNVNSDKKSEDL